MSEQKQSYELARSMGANLPARQEWETITSIAQVIAQANNMSMGKMADILLKGVSVGLSIPASIELVQNVQGKSSLSPRGAWALVQNSPVIADTKLTRLADDKGAFIGYECYIKRQNGFEYTARWTMADAHRAGLVKAGSGWVNYPENMCLWRAVGFACDVAASDVTSGLTAFLKTPEAYNTAIDDRGNVIEGVVSQPVAAAHLSPNPLAVEIERLMATYDPAEILEANGGKIPETLEECAKVEATFAKVETVIVETEGGAE